MNQLQNPRELRGLAILSQPDTVREVRKNHWMVKSQSGNGEYLVTREYLKNKRWIWTCACPDHTTRHMICKHIYAVQFSLKLKDDVEHPTFRSNTTNFKNNQQSQANLKLGYYIFKHLAKSF